MNKPNVSQARPLSALVGPALATAFKKQGFASREIVTRWADIVGTEIAAHAEPVRMQWPHNVRDGEHQPATLVLRVEGPAAIEIQHLSGLIIERVNRFFGWQAIDRLALRQAPLSHAKRRKALPLPDPEAARRVADELTEIIDEPLREALGRLGAAVKGK